MIVVNDVPLDWLFKDLYVSLADSCMFRNLSCLRCKLFVLFRGVYIITLNIYDGTFLRKFFFGFLRQIHTQANFTLEVAPSTKLKTKQNK